MARAKTSRGSWSQRGPDGEEFGGGVGFVLVMRFVAANSHNELTPGTILALDRDLPHSVEGLEESVVLLKLHLAEPRGASRRSTYAGFSTARFRRKWGRTSLLKSSMLRRTLRWSKPARRVQHISWVKPYCSRISSICLTH